MNWKADTVLGVLFTPPGQKQPSSLELWSELFPNDTPDQFQKSNPTPNLHSNASGIRDGFTVTIDSQTGRTQIVLGSANSPMIQEPPRIDNVEEAIIRLKELMSVLARKLDTVRLALVVDCSETVQDSDLSQRFRNELPHANLPENTIDPVYQFNVRKPFDFDNSVVMNRLCTWNTGHQGFVLGNLPPIFDPSQINMKPFIGFKIDVNSHGEPLKIMQNEEKILAELCNEAIAIYTNKIEHFNGK
tara:strand:+ start:7340 stop:8074 length:735 start_codon:yes stop_codon:yes gene_type:complete